jgi:hypothetical protein
VELIGGWLIFIYFSRLFANELFRYNRPNLARRTRGRICNWPRSYFNPAKLACRNSKPEVMSNTT